MFLAGVAGFRQVAQFVRGHPEPSRNIVDLKLARLQELRITRRQPDVMPGHTLFEYGCFPGRRGTLVHGGPGLRNQLLRFFFELAGVLQNTMNRGAIAEERSAKLFGGEADPHALGRIAHYAVAGQPVES